MEESELTGQGKPARGAEPHQVIRNGQSTLTIPLACMGLDYLSQKQILNLGRKKTFFVNENSQGLLS